MRVKGQVTYQELSPAVRKRMGLPALPPDETERQAYRILSMISKYDKEQRWLLLHRALQMDGGEPLPPPPVPLSERLWNWLIGGPR